MHPSHAHQPNGLRIPSAFWSLLTTNNGQAVLHKLIHYML